MKTVLNIVLIAASLTLAPMAAEAGFCGSKKKNKHYYPPQYAPVYWPARSMPLRYYYYSYPRSFAYY
jgi:hypothetical protein